jgi:Zn ribbon nucleic-acid-binding protein
MATNPKMKPCPKCGTDEWLDVYKYDNGWQHVECDKCFYLGPGEGSVRQAIKSHNEKVASTLSGGNTQMEERS